MAWYDNLNPWKNSEGDDHVWRDDEGTVCVRLYNEGVTPLQLLALDRMLEDGDYYNVYLGDNDFPDKSFIWNETSADDLQDEVPPYSAPEDILPKMPWSMFGLDIKQFAVAFGIFALLFTKQLRKLIR